MHEFKISFKIVGDVYTRATTVLEALKEFAEVNPKELLELANDIVVTVNPEPMESSEEEQVTPSVEEAYGEFSGLFSSMKPQPDPTPPAPFVLEKDEDEEDCDEEDYEEEDCDEEDEEDYDEEEVTTTTNTKEDEDMKFFTSPQTGSVYKVAGLFNVAGNVISLSHRELGLGEHRIRIQGTRSQLNGIMPALPWGGIKDDDHLSIVVHDDEALCEVLKHGFEACLAYVSEQGIL